MLLPFILAICALDLLPLDIGAMTLDRARTLDGKTAEISCIVAEPLYRLLGGTMVGAADREDDVERGAVLLGTTGMIATASEFGLGATGESDG